jgi:outer membrane protein assembly factor BamB
MALLCGAFTSVALGATVIGETTIQPGRDSNGPGVAEAFQASATASGTVTSMVVYVDSGSSASTLIVGLYTNASGKPGSLLAQGSLASPRAAAWNTVTLPGTAVTAGTTYWISLLGPAGSGTLRFRDRAGAGRAETSSQSNLVSLPASWTTGTRYTDGSLSAYGTTSASSPVLGVAPASLSFSATQGGADPAAKTLSVTNSGGGTLSYSASADVPWLSVTPASGNAPATLSVTAAIAGLAPNTYTGHVTVTASGAQGSPASVTVTLIVAAPGGSSTSWLQIEHDPGRTGSAPGETAITPANAAGLGLQWSATVDGKVTAQPLYASGVTVGGQTRDALVVATSANSVYALNPSTGQSLWRRNFGSQPNNCAIPGGFGVTAAPAIDAGANRVYVVANDGTLHALSLNDGTDAVPALQLIAGAATNKVWGGLTLVGGMLYVATASDGCDTSPWRGRVYRVDVSGTTPSALGSWDVVPGIPAPSGGGGIWGYGGVSVDTATGNVLAATGADSAESYQAYADRLVALDGGLNLLGSYEPFHPATFPCNGSPCDVDFGATPVVFQPSGCPTLIAAGNKNGNLYLFREADLAASGAPLQVLPLNPANDWLGSGGVGGVPAYWAGGRMLFVTDVGPGVNGVSAGVVGLRIASDCTLSVAWSQTLGGGAQPNSTPTVAGGVVYVGEGNGGAVHAYDAATGQALWQGTGPQVATYAAPIVANGTLFSGSWAGFAGADGGIVRAYSPGAGGGGGGGSTVLLGNQAIEAQRDTNRLGQAEAFPTTGAANGTMSSLSVYIDPTSTVSKVSAGIYANSGGHPGSLLAQAAVTSPTPGSWATIPLSTPISAGTTYWIALLGTGSGTIYFRDRANGPCVSEASSQTTLTSLPATWTTGAAYTDCPVSAYGTG